MNIFSQSFVVEGMEGRDISREYRELELLTEVELTPDSRVRVDAEGEVLGIYESFRGVKEAILRNDPHMALFFLARLNPVARERLIYELQSGKVGYVKYHSLALRTVLEELSLANRIPLLEVEIEEIAYGTRPFLVKDFAYRKTLNELYYLVSSGKEEALEQALAVFRKTTKANRELDASYLFSAALKSARIDFVNRVVEQLSTYLPYPRVEELVTEIGFVEQNFRRMSDYILHQGSERMVRSSPDLLASHSSSEHEIELRYYSDALRGGNPRLFVYIFALSGRQPLYDAYELVQGYYTRRNLLDRYICAQFFPLRDYALPATSSIDLYRILSQKLPEVERRDYALKFVSDNLGNVDILFHVLDSYPEEKYYIEQLIKDKYQGLYPLSERILANY
ncbi:Hypothetical protein BQ3484_230 [Cedratvirus A11]|uniref:Uncharacterized protein n=1 Tax=Cedratvirus A11 TaxID=1903266 RepID=A0A1M7XUU2_9VIRU|nr:Hypothetical protein BQ3484_230 [Cedratvirus A11]SHO33298.1 Hypothetical protein BQ3484_230 [Cedratvirus A11]